ncbi:MAG: SOS response-associated peptidase [Bacteroidia bacterium]
MCYNLSAKQRIAELQKMYGVRIDYDYAYTDPEKYYHVSGFAHPKLPVLLQDTEKRFDLMQWGLIPSFTKDEVKAKEFSNMLLNVRAETVFDKPMLKGLIIKKRCVLPVDGFYEWREIARVKYPYYIFPKDKGLFSLGCLYDTWTNKDTGEIINSIGILTTEANETMAMIHNNKKRMPLILTGNDWQQWINPTTTKEAIQALLKPSPNEILGYHTISKAISHRNIDTNYPDIQKEVQYPEIGVSSLEIFPQ